MDEEAIRKDFEVWATMKHYSLRCSESPYEYVYPDTQSAWDAWLESARQADKRAREECAWLSEKYRAPIACVNAIRATISESAE